MTQPAAFTSKIIKLLKNNKTHSLHARARKPDKYRRIVSRYPGNILQMDLVEMGKFSRKNNRYKYILMVIDTFSKKLYAEPIKRKTGNETVQAIKTIFSKMEDPPQTIIFDEGREFINRGVKLLLRQYNIHSYSILTKRKASVVERVNKTIKSIIWRYFTEHNTKKWIDVLQDIVSNYNNTYHMTIKMAPNQVTWDNRKIVFKNSFPKIKDRIKCRLKLNSRVRIRLNKNLFDKGFTINWTKEIYTIYKVLQKNGVCWYKLVDQFGKKYKKGKYYYDLQLVASA